MRRATGREAAGKTGTTDSYRDAWFVGYTPDLVTGVWVGNDDNSKLGGVTGGTVPAKIWADYMKVAVQSFPNSVFDYPETALSKNVDVEKEPQEILEGGEAVEYTGPATTGTGNIATPADSIGGSNRGQAHSINETIRQNSQSAPLPPLAPPMPRRPFGGLEQAPLPKPAPLPVDED